MNYKFLHKVLDQIVSETRIDYDGEIQFPFSPFPTSLSPFLRLLSSPVPPLIFTKHCEDVYGLNGDEVGYVWDEYTQIISDKLKNNG
jgi:hypothetical protein